MVHVIQSRNVSQLTRRIARFNHAVAIAMEPDGGPFQLERSIGNAQGGRVHPFDLLAAQPLLDLAINP
jgi:hypothetical protein